MDDFGQFEYVLRIFDNFDACFVVCAIVHGQLWWFGGDFGGRCVLVVTSFGRLLGPPEWGLGVLRNRPLIHNRSKPELCVAWASHEHWATAMRSCNFEEANYLSIHKTEQT